jgi:small subunit ribosomal protein S15
MARMHSRKKGRSGSKKPIKKEAAWVEYKPKEIEDVIVKLAKQGMQSAQIGIVLRDTYGIPSARLVTKKTIAETLKEKGVYSKLPEDIMNLLRKAVNLREHMSKNRKDYHSYHGLELTESKIRRLAKYYIRNKIMPKGWKYDPEQAKLLVR